MAVDSTPAEEVCYISFALFKVMGSLPFQLLSQQATSEEARVLSSRSTVKEMLIDVIDRVNIRRSRKRHEKR